MKVSNEGMVVLGEKVTGIEKVKVGIDGGGMVRLLGDVTFNNDAEAGIQIKGSKGNASVIGMGKGGTGEMVTMTVKGSGGGIEVEAGAGKVDATVMMLKIKGTGSGGMGVSMGSEGGTLNMNMVEVSGFTVGVNAKGGTVDINGDSTITVANSGTGIMVGSAGKMTMMGGSIKGGGGSGMYGVQVMGGTGTVELTKVGISKFGKGVDVTAGTLKMMGGTVTFTGGAGNYGVMVGRMGTANLTGTRITGEGDGKGVVMGSSETMTMTNVGISKVKVGVEVKKGTLEMMGGTVTFTGGNGNYGVKVETGAVADLTKVTIKGGGATGTGLYVMGTA
uniref:hypothetical protein n=1 Tax=Bartonella bovis TaxID=155194 RepID=UPI00195D1F36